MESTGNNIYNLKLTSSFKENREVHYRLNSQIAPKAIDSIDVEITFLYLPIYLSISLSLSLSLLDTWRNHEKAVEESGSSVRNLRLAAEH